MRSFHRAALISLCLAGGSGPAVLAEVPSDTAYIKAMEQSIVPAVVLAGVSHSPGSLTERMAFYNTPGVSLAYIHDGRIAWTRTYGLADKSGTRITVDTRFQAGSISKPVTALAVLRLAQSGKLNLDVDVNQYLKSWKVPRADDGKVITLRELLTHTAGLTVHGFAGYAQGQPVPTLVQVLNGEKPANSPAIMRFEPPGTEWRYSGGGYVIIQQVLQDVTGQAFPDLMQSLVLGPIGMTHSTYSQPLPEALKAEAATPYGPGGQPIPGGAHTYPEMAPAGLWTTPSDLALYAIEVQNALAGKSSRVINQATAGQYVKGGIGGWGLGIGVGGPPGHPWFSHNGANAGFRNNLVAFDSGDGFVVMTNSDNGDGLMEEVTRTVAAEYHWPAFGPETPTRMAGAPKDIDRYAGAYEITRFVAMIVARQGDALVVHEQQGPPPEQFLPESDRVWFSTQSARQLTFDFGPDGQVLDLSLGQSGQTQKLKRMPHGEVETRAAELAARVKAQVPDNRTEAAIRELIGSLRDGRPNYDHFGQRMGDATRARLPDLESDMKSLGDLKTIVFKGVGPGGGDIYEATFANGKRIFRILLDPQGRIDAMGIQLG
jgi:CubicO group peptidase (beta-lactamase class C family)